MTLILLALALLLAGCRVSGEVENQAYVLVLGLDTREDGGLTLTARVPKIGKGQSEDGPNKASDGYLLFSAGGVSYPQAMEALEQVTPRRMNLSHIALVVASEALARTPDFGALIDSIARTPHLYTTARFVICEGRASDFIEAQQTVIGTRLSSEISAMLDHYAEQGYIPVSTFADAFYAVNSFYGDPAVIRGRVAPEDQAQPAAALTAPSQLEDDRVSPMRQRFSGAVLLRGGSMAGTLDARQTQLMNLIRGDAKALPVDCGGNRYTLTPEGGAKREVRIDGGRVTLGLRLTLGSVDDICDADALQLASSLKQALLEVVSACQGMGVDPFGFADAAACAFMTNAAWRSFEWHSRFAEAAVEVDVRVSGVV